MSDDRPRPQYGEYATPEEQAAAMGRTYVPPTTDPVEALAAPISVRTSGGGQEYVGPRALAPSYLDRRPGFINRFFTVFFLGFGALSLIGDAPLYFNLGSALKGAYQSAGMDVAVPAAINSVGIPVLIVNIVFYAAALILSVFALRRGRISFYIPIVGFILYVLVFAIIVVAVAPGFAASAG